MRILITFLEFRWIALSMCLLLWGCKDSGVSLPVEVAKSTPVEYSVQRIEPSETGVGIERELRSEDYHYVGLPTESSLTHPVLVVYMNGSLGNPERTIEISQFVAGLGLPIISLKYPNDFIVGFNCVARPECYESLRGEAIYGENVVYDDGAKSYNEISQYISKENSVVNRILNLLDYLASQEPSAENPNPSFWKQFYRSDQSSPYNAMNSGPSYPRWSHIVVAGHSQGGGNSAMIGQTLGNIDPPRGVIMLSSPNDFDNSTELSASWIVADNGAPMTRFWGLRHKDDDNLGVNVEINWAAMGGEFSGGVGGYSMPDEVDVGNGSGDTRNAHRLVLSADVGDGNSAHGSTNSRELLPNVEAIWRYLFLSATE